MNKYFSLILPLAFLAGACNSEKPVATMKDHFKDDFLIGAAIPEPDSVVLQNQIIHLYPIPQTVIKCTGEEGSSSTLFLNLCMFTSTIFSSPKYESPHTNFKISFLLSATLGFEKKYSII